MKRLYKNLVLAALIFCLGSGLYLQSANSAVTAPAKSSAAASKTVTNPIKYQSVSPIDVVDSVPRFLNKYITFNAEFVAFTSLGLDYKPAFKDSKKYIGVLIRRPDVSTNVIPLSEMKIFLTREAAEKNIDVEAGDIVKIEGKVFSDALGDPWVEANSFTLITHKESKEKK